MNRKRLEVLGEGKYLRLVRQGPWEYAERRNEQGAVVIIPVADDGQIVLIEQYRVPVAARVIELPAGLVGDIPGESTEDWREIAHRELLEETGYRAKRMVRVSDGPVSAGFSSESVAFYLATGLTRVHAGGGVDHEEIRVHLVRPKSIAAWLRKRSRQGCLIDQKIYAGLHFVAVSQRGSPKGSPRVAPRARRPRIVRAKPVG
jgi:ADP-ribose pyrophosphatase